MKLFKWLGLTFLISTSVISTSALIFNNVNKQDRTFNPQNNRQADTIIDQLNTTIRNIKNEITKINDKVGQLLGEKERLTSTRTSLEIQIGDKQSEIENTQTLIATEKGNIEQLQETKGRLETEKTGLTSVLDKLNKEIKEKDEEIKKLKNYIEQLKKQLNAKEAELSAIKQQNDAYKEIVTEVWNQKMKDTVWGGETYQSLLDRFNKTAGFEFKLKSDSQSGNKIENGGDKKFRVKKGTIELELEMGRIYPKTNKQKWAPYVKPGLNSNQLVEFGWDENGKIEKVVSVAIKVPNQLPWFITNLSGAFAGNGLESIEGLDHWDVSNVTNMSHMFENAKNFNQNISNWNTSNVKHMEKMFWGAVNYKQNLSTWVITDDCKTTEFIGHSEALWKDKEYVVQTTGVKYKLWDICLPQKIKDRWNNQYNKIGT
ncbi:BspA family leucine-rich repeat surface protein [Mycoplasma cottewii]|uniref:BspA family leucine-rich repeat surface protein n=1 Tax=Mycoplasma cottewii TaxID=51364 RepID=A0ABY5TX50_9MOLU|nr:BspA family leucine-rich repeat surface protein [Mycoplasma cottewii]UWD34780.1 BspA family leucine-rich repeat surface protein [Mycoplasma cottewii]